MTRIEIDRVNEDYAMEARNEDGVTLMMDSTTDLGGKNMGMRPMQVLLTSLGGCTAIDVISILRKQRQDLKDIKITLEGERPRGKEATPYEKIHIHYKLFGNVDPGMAQKAISLSVDKYCSVGKTLEKTATITHTFEIIK